MKDNKPLSKVLYFPYIDVPKNNWTIQSILYWDNVSIIAPNDFIHEDEFTQNLADLNLISRVVPNNDDKSTNKLNKDMIDCLNDRLNCFNVYRKNFQNNKIILIHMGKITYEIRRYLEENRLAEEYEKDYQWLKVEVTIGNIIMAYLAKYLCETCRYIPSTDNQKFVNRYYKNSIRKVDTIRNKFLNDLIPYPNVSNIELKKLKDFKNKYEKQLRRFRNAIEQDIIDINLLETMQSPKYVLKVEEINSMKEDIIDNLKQFGFKKIIFSTLCKGIATYLSFQVNALNGAINFVDLASSLEQQYNQYEWLLNNKYSYLALIESKLKSKMYD
jgi:uncharacterized protein (UPF0305 family)